MGAFLDRYGRWLAWSLVGVYVLLAGIGLSLLIASTTPSFFGFTLIIMVVLVIVIGIFPVIGALIITRHPRHPVGWLLFAAFPVVAIDMFMLGYATYATLRTAGAWPIPGAVFVWLNWSGLPFVIVAMTLMNLLFPTGRLPSPRWRPVAWAMVAALPLFLGLLFIEPGPLDLLPALDNPYAVAAPVWRALAPFYAAAIVVLIVCSLASFISLVLRLRRARGDERQQVKWLVAPAFLFWLGIPILLLSSDGGTGLLNGLGIGLHVFMVPVIVVVVAVAIFRYRLYDVDIIINRTLVYGSLTLSLALIYFASVVALQQILLALTGQQSPLAIVVSTLFIAALFTPLRRRIQAFIDRRFYRHKYDAARTLAAFAATARDEIDLDELTAELLRVVDETMQPAALSLWLKER